MRNPRLHCLYPEAMVEIAVDVFLCFANKKRIGGGGKVGGVGGFGGERGRRKALQKERGEKRKSENKRTTRSGRGQEGHEERMGKMKGEAYYSQTDGPLSSQRPPPGTRRDDSLHLRVTGGCGAERGGASLT